MEKSIKKPIKKLALMAILTAIALIIFIIEAQIPLPLPIPGVKLGLANAVTLFALFFGRKAGGKAGGQAPCLEPVRGARGARGAGGTVLLTVPNAFAILICRILLGAVFTGRPIVLVYSLVGGVLGFIVQVIMRRFVTEKQIWACGAAGAIFHNIGQILAAIIITGTPAIAAYLPLLIIAGTITGVITGLIAQLTIDRLNLTAEPSL